LRGASEIDVREIVCEPVSFPDHAAAWFALQILVSEAERDRITPKPVERALKAATPTVKFEIAEKARLPAAPPPSTKPCSGHMGGLLGAVKKDGRPYRLDFGSNCSYKHISPAGKSDEKVLECIESMSATARFDLRKAIRAAAANQSYHGSWTLVSDA
jgi:hypothetical protein